ncbi:MAG: hypothetical protein UMU04_02310 [Halanaerobiales bacterium]|nr:hypothetical protein [Halanaerobiales bacterium]
MIFYQIKMRDYMEGGEEIGSVVVPEKITDLTKKDFYVYIELDEKENKYYIVSSGNVYPILFLTNQEAHYGMQMVSSLSDEKIL